MVDNSSGSYRGVGAVSLFAEVRNTLNVASDFCVPSLLDVLETMLLCDCGNWDQQLLQG